MAELVNKPMRKGLKVMAQVAWTAKVISQMPQPKDFALMITSDIITFTGKVQRLSKDMNEMMDTYLDMPFEYLNKQLDALMDSTVSVINKANKYAKDNINDVSKFTTDLTDELIKGDGTNSDGSLNNLITKNVDLFKDTTDLVLSSSNKISKGISTISNKDDVTSQLNEAIKGINQKTTEGLNKAKDALNKTNTYIKEGTQILNNTVDDVTSKVNGQIKALQQQIKALLDTVKNLIKKFSSSIDDAFGVKSITSSKLYNTALDLSGLDVSDSNDSSGMGEAAGTLITETSKTVCGILENFSIGKFITGCTSMIAVSTMMETGVMQLPTIDVEKMLTKLKGKIKNKKTVSFPFDAQIHYDDSNYKSFTEKFEDDLKKQRDDLRLKLSKVTNKSYLMQDQQSFKINTNTNYTLSEYNRQQQKKSAIKEQRKLRRKARRAKIINNVKNKILDRLKSFVSEMKEFFNSVKEKWNAMIQRYKDSVKEIKSFFTKDGHGDKTIEKICEDINQNFDNIKQLCTVDMPTQIANVSVDVTLPRAFGMCCTNFAQHVVQFFAECKVIIKFIMDIIRYIRNIIKDIKEIMNIILSGINNMLSILKQLYDLFSLKWLLNLVQKVKDLFSESVSNAASTVESSLQPLYFKDTEYYQNVMDAIDALSSGTSSGSTLSTNEILSYAQKIGNDVAMAQAIYTGGNSVYDEDKVNTFIQSWYDLGDTIIAYRSLKFKKDSTGKVITTKEDDSQTDDYDSTDVISVSSNGYTCDIPTVEYYDYFHPNLDHKSWKEFAWQSWSFFSSTQELAETRRSQKAKFIQRAAEKAGKNGGVNMLKNNTNLYKNAQTGNKVGAYDAFYWYRKYVTNDDFYEDEVIYDATDGDEILSQKAKVSVTSDNGSVVTITLDDGTTQKLFVKNAQVKSGDYVTYNGKKYKVV